MALDFVGAVERQQDFGVFVRAVVAAVELGDLAAAGERAGGLNGHHHRLGARVREAELLDAGDALDQQFGEADLALGRKGNRGAERELAGDGLHDARVGMAVDQRRVIVHEVELDAGPRRRLLQSPGPRRRNSDTAP